MAKFNFNVTVQITNEGNKYFIDGIASPKIILEPGVEYIFDQSDVSNSLHPLLFSEVSDGYHNGGSDLGSLFTQIGTPGSEGAQTKILINNNVPESLSYFCSNHSGMGSSLYIDKHDEYYLGIENHSSEDGNVYLKQEDNYLALPIVFDESNSKSFKTNMVGDNGAIEPIIIISNLDGTFSIRRENTNGGEKWYFNGNEVPGTSGDYIINMWGGEHENLTNLSQLSLSIDNGGLLYGPESFGYEKIFISENASSTKWYKNGNEINNVGSSTIEINSDEFADLFSYAINFEHAGENYLFTSQNAVRILNSENVTINKKKLSEDDFDQLIDTDIEYDLKAYDHIDLKNNLNVTNTSNIKNIDEIYQLVDSISSLEYTEGIIIIKDGEVIAEKYYGESSEVDANRIYSVTKSFLSTIYGRAEKLGLISNIDKTLGEIFPDILISEPQASITIKDLLLMRSGYSDFYAYQNINIISDEETSGSYFSNVSIEDLLNMPIDEGQKGSFFYNNSAEAILSYVFYEETGLLPSDFADQELFPYLGINPENVIWTKFQHPESYEYFDQSGVPENMDDMVGGMFMRLEDMTKLGLLFLQDGYVDLKNQIISSDWVKQSTNSPDGSPYGFLWWLDLFGQEGYSAQGLEGQMVFVNPSKDIVIGLQSREQFYDELLEMIENGEENPNLGQAINGEYESMIFPIIGQILQLIEPNEKNEIYEIKLPKNSNIEIALKYDQQNDEGYVFNRFIKEFEWLMFDSAKGKVKVVLPDDKEIKELVQVEFVNQSGELDYQSFVVNSRDYDEGNMSESDNPETNLPIDDQVVGDPNDILPPEGLDDPIDGVGDPNDFLPPIDDPNNQPPIDDPNNQPPIDNIGDPNNQPPIDDPNNQPPIDNIGDPNNQPPLDGDYNNGQPSVTGNTDDTGITLYSTDGEVYSGDYHQMADGSFHSGSTHDETLAEGHLLLSETPPENPTDTPETSITNPTWDNGGDEQDQEDGMDLSGFNIIETGAGDDVVLGGYGSDYVDTQGGADTIFTGDGEDIIKISGDSGGGLVTIDAGYGSDSIIIDGFSGEAELIAGGGEDTLTIVGGYDDLVMSNTDLVLNISGSSIIIKDQLVDDGTGNLVFNENGGIGLIVSVEEDENGDLVDTAVALDPTVEGDLGLILLTDGDDQYATPYDSPNDFQISGFAGNDTILGGSFDDVIYGGDGDDMLAGSDGDDQIYGGTGSDIIDGGFGTDTLIGGEDSDIYMIDIMHSDGNEDVIVETQGESDKLFVIGTTADGMFGQIQSDGNLYLNFESVFSYYEPDYGDDPNAIIHPNYTEGYPTDGYPTDGYPTDGYLPPEDYPTDGYLPPVDDQEDYPTDGYLPPEDYPTDGYLPPVDDQEDYPTDGYLPPVDDQEDYPTDGYLPPEDYPADGYPYADGNPEDGMPTDGMPADGYPNGDGYPDDGMPTDGMPADGYPDGDGYPYDPESASVMIQGFADSNSQDSVEQIILVDDQYAYEVMDRFTPEGDEFRTPELPPIDDYSGRLVVNIDTDTHFWAEHGSEAMQYLEQFPDFKDLIQINKSDDFVEVNIGPPHNKQLFKIPNFEVIELKTSFDDGFKEFIDNKDLLDVSAADFNNLGSKLSNFSKLNNWMKNNNVVKRLTLEDQGDKLTLTNPLPNGSKLSIFSFDKELLIGYETLNINIGLGKEFDLSESFDRELLEDYYSEIPEVVLEIPSGDTVQETIDWGLENGMLNVYHLDTDGIVDPEDQLDYYLIGNPNDATPWDPSTGGESQSKEVPGIYFHTNDEGQNIITSNPEDEPIVIQEWMTMTSGGAGDDILQAIDYDFDDWNVDVPTANAFQIMAGRDGDDLFHIESGAYFALGGAGDDTFYIGEDDFVFGNIMGDRSRMWSDDELALAESQGILDTLGTASSNVSFNDVLHIDIDRDDVTITEESVLGESYFNLEWNNVDGISSTISVYDVEKIVFNDTEVLLTDGKPVTASDWLNQDLASQFDFLDHKDISFDIQEDTINVIYQGNETGGAPELLWSGSRFEVDYFEMPGGNDVNVVNWQTESPVTQTFTDPNNQTTTGRDLIFGTDDADYIDGKGGDDIIYGGYGDDVIVGGEGMDQIFGGGGQDKLYGDAASQIAQELFADNNYALTSSEELNIQGSRDLIVGGDDLDEIYGGEGSDVIVADNPDFDFDGDVDADDFASLGSLFDEDETV